ncbi:diguanylate cyclase [Aliidiomarina sp. Khilg15.8]
MTQTIERNDSNLHWMMQMLQTVEVGLVVIDDKSSIQLWNSFMENHSGIRSGQARDQNLFTLFPELPEKWLQRKINSVFTLRSRAYCTWEQRPRLFDFNSFRPLTGKSDKMYQNITMIPLTGAGGDVSHVCILVYDVTEIAMNKQELERANSELARLSRTDRLTNLYNRGYWEECLEQEFHRRKRYAGAATLVMFDIDHFKPVNDTYGHQLGDDVIRMVAHELLVTQRETDIAGRYGGEEFCVLLPDTDADQALLMAERLRKRIADIAIEVESEHGEPIQITISLGIAAFETDLRSHNEWIERADKALYQSKRGGRDRSTMFNSAS